MYDQYKTAGKIDTLVPLAAPDDRYILICFFLVISVTGLLLGVKKQAGLLAPTQKGVSKDLSTWLHLDSLHKNAIRFLRDSVSADLSAELERIDVRPDKGIVKFTFKDHVKGLQLDGTNGQLLSVETRKSDFIEKIHDGSILDKVFGTSGDQVKLSYTIIMGFSLFMLVLSASGCGMGPSGYGKKDGKPIHKAGARPKIRGVLTSYFTFLCSIRTKKMSKLQAAKVNYDRGSHIKRMFE